jgi:hypothetical protein
MPPCSDHCLPFLAAWNPVPLKSPSNLPVVNYMQVPGPRLRALPVLRPFILQLPQEVGIYFRAGYE